MVHFGCSLSRRQLRVWYFHWCRSVRWQGWRVCCGRNLQLCVVYTWCSIFLWIRNINLVAFLFPTCRVFLELEQVRSDSTCSIDQGAEAVLQVCHWNSSGQKSFYWWLRFWLAIESAGWSQRSDGGQVHARDRWGLENWHLEKTWTAKKETSYEQMNEWTSVECLKFELWPNAHCRQKGAN